MMKFSANTRRALILLSSVLIFAACSKSSGGKGEGAKATVGTSGTPVAAEGGIEPKPQALAPLPEKNKPTGPLTTEAIAASPSISPPQIQELKALALAGYPEVTAVVGVRDASLAETLIEGVGGRVDYNPNLGRGSNIHFLVVTLPPAKLVDTDFLKSLELIDIQVNMPQHNYAKPALNDAFLSGGNTRVPFSEVGIDELRKRKPGKGLGEGITVAVIDTGIDPSHHVFTDRVIYWSDETQEGRVALNPVKLTADGDLILGESSQPLPAKLKNNNHQLYMAWFDEKAMAISQADELERKNNSAFFDINRNQRADKMLVLVYKDTETKEWLALYDADANQLLSESEADRGIMDFNRWRSAQKNMQNPPYAGFVSFKATNRSIKYPLMIERNKNDEPTFVSVGVDFGEHGTHVAGIAAAGGERIEGAAPKANIMSLKVCTKVTCTTPAIIRGLLRAFYNEQGLVPDIVNISLGSPQGYRENVFDRIIRDLSAKFGTVFFIAASNDGPGYRSINDLGSLSPAILVGAHASRQTLIEHYKLNEGIEIQKNQLLLFSSVGPSFSGELRPNLVAPGSALSSTPLASSRSSMFNGTSMSSPLAAGATAALMSLLKAEPAYAPFDELIQKKRQLMQKLWRGEDADEGVPYSLNSVALAFRTALEESASRTDFANYSSAQIGHGLLNVNRAYDVMLAKAQSLAPAAGGFRRFNASWRFNDNAGQAVYERGVTAKRAKSIKISLNIDGEESEQDLEAMEVEPITVKLVRVEEQADDGLVTLLDPARGSLPFSLGDSFKDHEAHESTVVISNPRKADFVSIRHLDRMKDGHTYLAVYDLYQFGERINTLLDVVHRPAFFSDVSQTYHLPSISSDPIVGALTLARSKKHIKAGQFHRYFVPVFTSDTRLEVSLGLPDGQNGMLSVMVFDPDGRPVASDNVTKTEGTMTEKLLTKVRSDTTAKKGLYEVVVVNSNGTYLADASYDLLIHKVRFLPSGKKINLKPGEEQLIVFNDLTAEEYIVSASAALTRRVLSLGSAKVIPNHRTFTRLAFPPELRDIETFTVSIAFPENSTTYWRGRLDSNLYTSNAAGDAEALAGTAFLTGSDKNKSFTNVDLGKNVFLGIETTAMFPDDQRIDNRDYMSVPLEAELFTKAITEELTITRDSTASDAYANVFKIKAPNELKVKGAVLRGYVAVNLASGLRFTVPVEVAP